MPNPLISRQDIANGSVSGQPRKFDSFGGKTRAARVHFIFPTANLAVGMPHALGRTPSAWRVVNIYRDGVPGAVYSPIQGAGGGGKSVTSGVFNMSRQFVILACETANTVAEIELT